MKKSLNIEFKNASWIIGGRILQMLISLFVSLLTARYLGPKNFGLVNYGAAYVAFFSSICTLGINSIIIKDFSDYPNKEGEALGTSIVLRILSSILSALMIICIVAIVDKGDQTTILVVALCCIALIFQAFDTINYWFQFQYQSKITAIVSLVAYVFVAIYRIVLLILNKDVKWFALATSIDYICIAFFLIYVYRRNNGPKLKVSKETAKRLLSKSYHYILSGMMVAIYSQTDKFMLKQMMTDTDVGYYSVATAICSMWVFILQAIIDSMYPSIINMHKKNREMFNKKNKQLYCIVFYVSIIVSVLFVLFGEYIVIILYGREYVNAITPLKIVTWYTAFSYLGVARNAWIVCENKQKYLKYIYSIAAILNVLLNAVMIPLFGVSGAAFASLITNIATSVILPMFIKELRPNTVLILEGITLKRIK